MTQNKDKTTIKSQWTDDQLRVIEARDTDLLVSAAAGSGKTAVLVERIIGLITDDQHPIDIDEMLVVTFTKAAAAEMKNRVRAALKKRIAEASSDIARLKKQEIMLNNAQISTLHSFCMNLIKNHFHEIDLDPGYHMASEGEQQLLKEQAMREVFEEEFAATSDGFLAFVDAYGSKYNEDNCKKMIRALYDLAESAPWPTEWLDQLLMPYECTSAEEFYATNCVKGALATAKLTLNAYQEQFASFMEETSKVGLERHTAVLQDDLDTIQSLIACDDFGSFGCVLDARSPQNTPTNKTIPNVDGLKSAITETRKNYKEFLKKTKGNYFSKAPEETLRALHGMEPFAAELIRLTKRYDDRYAALKRSKNALDYADLEHFAIRILYEAGPEHGLTDTAYALRAHYRAVMIDEYQDSNRIQEALVDAVCSPNVRFGVGDIKQSIYRFRMAEPSIFLRLMTEYTDPAQPNKCRIDLSRNFRSRKQVLDFTNQIFASLMQPDLGGIDYDAKAALYCGAEYYPPDPGMEVELLLGDSGDADKGELEALIIADRIRQMVNKTTIYDKELHEMRPLAYRDIVILARSLGNCGPVITKVLKEKGIPVVAMEENGYFNTPEIACLLNVLKIIDNPYQDIPLVSVLKNFFALSNDKLALIGSDQRESSFACAFFAYAADHADEEDIRTVMEFLARYRKAKEDTPLHVILSDIIKETRYLEAVSCLPGGKSKRENIRKLIDLAINYESGSFSGVFSFLNYIDQMQKYHVEYGMITNMPEDDDTVKLMTIHKSKGLEFPVVFVSDVGRKFNAKDEQGDMVVDSKAGLGLRTIDLDRRVKDSNIYYEAIRNVINSESLGEEMRVLYVALTRAREKLILTGSYKSESVDKLREKYAQRMTPDFTLDYATRKKASCYLDWILPIVCAKDPGRVCFVDRENLALTEAADRVLYSRTLADLKKPEDTAQALYDLKEDLHYHYPYAASAYKSKYSVSEIKHRAIDQVYADEESQPFLKIQDATEEFTPMIPAFLQEEMAGRSLREEDQIPVGALKGTAFHRFMECLDFRKLVNLGEDASVCQNLLEEEKKRILSAGLMTAEELDLASDARILTFMQSELASRMAVASRQGLLYKEQPFVMGGNPADFFSLVDSAIVREEDGFCLIQGIIDAYFIEDDHIILMDYKTDSVKSAEELIRRYGAQLKLYAMALNRVNAANQRQVSEILIYSTCLSQTIPLEV